MINKLNEIIKKNINNVILEYNSNKYHNQLMV